MAALALLGALPSRAVDSARINADSYLLALDGVMSADLQDAIREILSNSLGHAFFPSPPEIRGECDRIFRDRAQRRANIDRQRSLDAERLRYARPIKRTEVQKAVATAAYDRFLASHAAIKAEERQETRAPVIATKAAFIAKYGIDETAFDRLPDAPIAKWMTGGTHGG